MTSTLTAAYGRGLLSEHTLALRLESLLRGLVVDPALVVGDLCLRRPEDTLRGRLAQTMDTVRGRVSTLFADTEEPMPTLLALDWSEQSCELLVGRSDSCDVVLTDLDVSRHHARLRCRDGLWSLEDLGSRNGTTLNGRPVGRCELRPGDDLALAGTHLRID